MIPKAERTVEQAVTLVDQAIRRKELLRQRRLAALNDVPRNENGDNLDDQQEVWRRLPVKRGMHKTFAESVIGLVQRQAQLDRRDHEMGRSNFEAVRNTELAIANMELTAANRAAGEFMQRRAISADQHESAMAAEEYLARDLIRTDAGSIIPELDMCQGAAVRCTAFSADGELLATGDQSGDVRLWARRRSPGARPWRGCQQLRAHRGPVTALAFVPAGDLGPHPHLLSASGDCTVKRWTREPAGGKWRLAEDLPAENSSWVLDLCYIGVEEGRRYGVPDAMLLLARGDRSLGCVVATTRPQTPPPCDDDDDDADAGWGGGGAVRDPLLVAHLAARKGQGRGEEKEKEAAEGEGARRGGGAKGQWGGGPTVRDPLLSLYLRGEGKTEAAGDGQGEEAETPAGKGEAAGERKEDEGGGEEEGGGGEEARVRWKAVGRMEGHTDAVVSCGRSARGVNGALVVVSVAADWTVRLWRQGRRGDAGSWVCECTIMDGAYGTRTRGCADLFPGDGTVLASAYRDRVLLFRLLLGADPADLLVGHALLATLRGHVGDVTCVAFRADGRLLASSDTLGEVKLWQRAEGAGHEEWGCVATAHAGEQQACGLRFGSGEAVGALVVCSRKGRVRVWETQGLAPLGVLPGQEEEAEEEGEAVEAAEAAAEEEGWGVGGGSAVVGPCHSPVVALGTMLGEGVVVAAGYGGGIGVWAVEEGEMERRLPLEADVTQVALLKRAGADGHVTKHVVCGGEDGAVKVVQLEGEEGAGRRKGKRVCGEGGGAVAVLEASEGGERVLAVWESGRVVVWETAGWREELAMEHAGGVSAAALHWRAGYGSYVALAGRGRREEGTVVRYHLQMGRQAGGALRLHAGEVQGLRFDPQGQALASVGKGERQVKVTSLETEEVQAELCGHEREVTALQQVAGGGTMGSRGGGREGGKGRGEALLVSGDGGGGVRVWTWGGECRAVLRGHADGVRCLAGEWVSGRVLVASGSGDGTVRVWEAGTGECKAMLVGESGCMQQVRGRLERLKVEIGFGDDGEGRMERAAQQQQQQQQQQQEDEEEEEEEEEEEGAKGEGDAEKTEGAGEEEGGSMRREGRGKAGRGREGGEQEEVRRMRAYLEAVRWAEALEGVATAGPKEALAAGRARRARAAELRRAEEAVAERKLTEAQRRRRQRTRGVGEEGGGEPASEEESTAQRRRAALWMVGELLRAVQASGERAVPGAVAALLRHTESFDAQIRACALLALCFVGARAQGECPGAEESAEEDQELCAAREEAEEAEEALLGLAEEAAGLEEQAARVKEEYEAECRRAAKDKRKGREMRAEAERMKGAAMRRHAGERVRLVGEQMRAMQEVRGPLGRLAEKQGRWVVQGVVRAAGDEAGVVREAAGCALAALARRGDARAAEAGAGLVGDAEEGVRGAGVVCLGEVGLGSQAAVRRLVALLGREQRGRVRGAALEGLAVLLRQGGAAASRHQRALAEAALLLQDPDAGVREKALLVGAAAALGDRAGLPHFRLDHALHLDQRPPFAPSPFVPYAEPAEEEELRRQRRSVVRRGVPPHAEPPACRIPPHRSSHTGKQLGWPSQSGRLYSTSAINPAVQVPGVASAASRGEAPPGPDKRRLPMLSDQRFY